MGDWARKYERIGELPGEGTVMRGLSPDSGVVSSEVGLIELDDPDDTEAERPLRLKAGLTIGIGLDRLTLPSVEEDLLDMIYEGKKYIR